MKKKFKNVKIYEDDVVRLKEVVSILFDEINQKKQEKYGSSIKEIFLRNSSPAFLINFICDNIIKK